MCSLPIPSGKRRRIFDCFPPEAHAASRALFRGGSPTDPSDRSLPPLWGQAAALPPRAAAPKIPCVAVKTYTIRVTAFLLLMMCVRE